MNPNTMPPSRNSSVTSPNSLMPLAFRTGTQPGRMSRAERGLLHDLWGAGMTGAPRGGEIIDELRPAPDEPVVTKYRYSAFFRTGLGALLSSLGRDQLIVCGVFAHIGCLFTVGDAFSRDIEAFLLVDGIADFSLRDHLMALDYAARVCAVTMTTDELREALRPPLPCVAASARQARPAT